MTASMASVVITTRNRREDTLRAVASCFAQDHRPLEVLVFDDASEDGTAEAVRAAFPEARVFAGTERSGYIALRNRGFREARGEFVFSIDDDAYFSTPAIVGDAVATFRADDTLAAVAIPFVEPLARQSVSTRNAARLPVRGAEIRAYVGCSHAVRRDAVLRLGGYREFFVHQGEERDLCIRMRDAGMRIVYADCDRIVHTVSPARDRTRMVFYGTRNTLLFDFLNAPMPEAVVRLARDVVGLAAYRFSPATTPAKLRAFADAAWTAWRVRGERRPASRRTWRAHRSLPGHGPEPFDGPIPPPAGAAR